MVPKILCLLTVSVTALISSIYGHSTAFSSQQVSRHNGPAHEVYISEHSHGHIKDHGQKHGHIDYYAHPKYDFEYKILDPHTGDYKSYHEDRDGDVVKGFYEFKEADGTLRRVEYHADKHTGFHATVHKTHHV